ncbi:MAG: type II secretion system F family protein [Candidatus Omnitrophica bacterium]|nr:type II secretion system F family protein [Candidatus Omnitrophota bacterium]
MAIFIYKAKKSPVEIVNGEMEAASPEDVVNRLTSLGLVPVTVIDRQAHRVQAAQKPEFIKLKTREVDLLTRQLASLLKAGVPLLRALTLIGQQAENSAFKNVIGSLEKQIREGKMLSDAMDKYPMIFNHLYINMVKSGEKGGSLDEVLYSLVTYQEREHEIRQKVQAALAYPLLMAIVGVGTVFVMLTFFMPKFIGLFEDIKHTLPLSTRILIGVSHFMSGHWFWFVAAFVLILLIAGRIREGSKPKALLDFVKLHLPVIKKFVKDAEVAKFARTLSVLIRSGISVVDGLELATDILDNMALKERLKGARLEIINQGNSLSVSLSKTKVLPNFVVNMILVGEEGGKLAGALKEIADLYEREVEQGIKITTSLLEPMMILAIGSVVGFIVFAMLLPIFDIEMTVH